LTGFGFSSVGSSGIRDAFFEPLIFGAKVSSDALLSFSSSR